MAGVRIGQRGIDAMSELDVTHQQTGVPKAPDAAADSPSESRPLKVFISYRREDTSGQALLVYKALAERFGSENVFMDVAQVRPGMSFYRVINDRVAGCDVLLALIGPRWLTSLNQRTRRRLLDQSEDYVRLEVEAALRRGSGVRVIPILIDDTVMPSANELPRSLRSLALINASSVRHTSLDEDVNRIIEVLEEVADEIDEARDVRPGPPPVTSRPPTTTAPKPAISPARDTPDAVHYADVARWIAEDGTVIPFLGPGVNAGGREEGWKEGGEHLPDDQEIATYLARKFDYPWEPKHLSEVSQYVFMTKGRSELFRTLRRLLTARCAPTSVHRFLAGMPGRLQELGFEPKYQLVVTTNYDDALERAFDDVNEPYDLTVYMATGEHRGKFLHIPYDLEARVINTPNTYVEFPIDEFNDLDRTVIVKIHGAVDNTTGLYPWRENYVITEDNYIDYLSRSPVEDLIPLQILDKLRESHFLFLGYAMRDWGLRVILQRIWGQQRLDRSWAIQRDSTDLDREFWNEFGVDLYSTSLAAYVQALDDELAALTEARAGP
jgi:hypothetical protein